MRPRWQEIESEMPELETEYYDADENPEKMEEWQIEEIPVFIFVDKEGNEIIRLQGTQSKEDLTAYIKEHWNK